MTPTDQFSTLRPHREPPPRAPSVLAALSAALVFFFLPANVGHAGTYTGRVVDDVTRQPIAGAIVTLAGNSIQTHKDGTFRIEGPGDQIGIRAYGYSRHHLTPSQANGKLPTIRLRPFSPRAVYLSLPAIDDPALREAVVSLVGTTRVNALVIDVKDKHGIPAFRGSVPAVIHDGTRGHDRARYIRELLSRLNRHGMYAIARVAVFKDDYLAQANPDMALRTNEGFVFRGQDGVAWTDPRNKAVWDYNIAVAIEAARQGFDEIQFDYVRFPSYKTSTHAPAHTAENRRAAIRGYLAEARAALMPYTVFVAADIFGYASWDPNDTNIGQKLEDIAAEVDYISLMLYPSSFKHGIPGQRMPLDYPGKIVGFSLKRAQQRTGLPAIRFRPWLQAFRDYNFDRRQFRRPQIIAQTRAAERFGSNGWMLLHPLSIYSAKDLP